jgi:acetyl esterase/lipase
VKAALRWIHAHAADYGISEDHIAVIGGSAGSFLALMLGITDAADYRDELSVAQDSTLETTNLSARSDVHTVIDHWGGPGLIDAIEAISPGDRWDATDAPISIIHGRSDESVPFPNAEEIVAHADRVGLPYTFRPFDGGHGEWRLEVDGQNLHELAFDFILEHQDLVTE